MSEGPQRHPEIPASAVWLPEWERWEALEAGGDGAAAKTGPARQYRPDGTLYMECRYDNGVQDGPFTIYHASGGVARRGCYVRGNLHGPVEAFTTGDEGAEPLRACCVPDNARLSRAYYVDGQMQFERFFDAQDRLLLSDGRICPARPAGLPERAQFEEGAGQADEVGRWMVPPAPDEPADTLWRFYDHEGLLCEEARFDEGWKVFARTLKPDGSLHEESGLSREGRRLGAYRRRYGGLAGVADDSPYLDGRVVEVRGEHLDDQPVGRWSFVDSAGTVVRTVERGQPLSGDSLGHPVWRDEVHAPEVFADMADSLLAEGRTGEAICATARAAARKGEVDDLVAFLARHTVPLAPEPAVALAETVAGDDAEPLPGLVAALVGGGEPAALFRALATAQREAPHAGRDFAEVSILLAPDRPMSYLTRALLRLELGDDRGALADAERLKAVSPESRQFVRDYARLLLPEWGFWPSRERMEVPDPGAAAADAAPEGGGEGEADENLAAIPDGPTQPLPAIRRLLQVYATRMARLREAVLRKAPRRSTAGWVPPALTALLPEGPVDLRRYTAEITDQTDDGPETISVEIDETLDPNGAPLPALMRVARSQWAAITWLCWACGLDRVALPEVISPPPSFPLAAGSAIARFFRVQDVITTGGLRSQSAGIPGFAWEGMQIDEAPRPFVQLAVDEYYELRALFLWLLSPENLSPFQSDLREVG